MSPPPLRKGYFPLGDLKTRDATQVLDNQLEILGRQSGVGRGFREIPGFPRRILGIRVALPGACAGIPGGHYAALGGGGNLPGAKRRFHGNFRWCSGKAGR